MERVTTVAELRARVRAARREGARIGFVPTMGALHEGHLSLVRAASEASDVVVASIFVNPLQFGEGEDLDAYPRDLDGDEAKLSSLGDAAPDLVFAPSVDEVYPRPIVTTVTVSAMADRLCGASRPGHFDGVTTVVSKLFNLVQPDVAFFGRKDFQQLQIIRRMVDDLNIPVEVVGCPLIREADGLALSSRNKYLDDAERKQALALSRALRGAVEAARNARSDGRPPSATVLREAAASTLGSAPGVEIDYVEVVRPDDLAPPDEATRGEASDDAPEAAALLVAVAAHVGPARLIDNVLIGDPADEDRVLRATSGDAGH